MVRAPGTGEEMVLDRNLFLRTAFTGGVLTPVNDEDLETYLAPYPTRDSRRPPHPRLGAPDTARWRAGRAGCPEQQIDAEPTSEVQITFGPLMSHSGCRRTS
jgi:hypothetical protein